MLKVNVGLSRKLSKDFNSAGFSVNFEGEVCAPLDDPQLVIERVKELYDLADETLAQQMERYQTQQGHDSLQSLPSSQALEPLSDADNHSQSNHPPKNGQASQSDNNRPEFVPATNKQISFLLNIGKRQGLNKPQLENQVAALIGRRVDVYQLSKQEAGLALDHLAAATNSSKSKQLL